MRWRHTPSAHGYPNEGRAERRIAFTSRAEKLDAHSFASSATTPVSNSDGFPQPSGVAALPPRPDCRQDPAETRAGASQVAAFARLRCRLDGPDRSVAVGGETGSNGSTTAGREIRKPPFDRISWPMSGDHPIAVAAGSNPHRQLPKYSSRPEDCTQGLATGCNWPVARIKCCARKRPYDAYRSACVRPPFTC